MLGIVIGAWSTALGLGGGLLTAPVMLVLFGSPLYVAEGTALMVMLPNALAETLGPHPCWRSKAQ
ncbi:hypothetical protein [Mycobacterium attenuatum]|uniref:hypothetical protein n=1 Tax=Mycobacterium attenuatum TaxID=2341086 RepID=UPI000F22AF8D|nr:hypothetical protein [Mycobacterium attenuatum]VBA56990.1 hypothetical protein LAUMK41_02242 [Mycobacterium attenuatum]